MDFLEIKGKEHYLYDNEKEFRALGNQMPLRHYWRDGAEGEWVRLMMIMCVKSSEK